MYFYVNINYFKISVHYAMIIVLGNKLAVNSYYTYNTLGKTNRELYFNTEFELNYDNIKCSMTGSMKSMLSPSHKFSIRDVILSISTSSILPPEQNTKKYRHAYL